jgi:hypothetical protein
MVRGQTTWKYKKGDQMVRDSTPPLEIENSGPNSPWSNLPLFLQKFRPIWFMWSNLQAVKWSVA